MRRGVWTKASNRLRRAPVAAGCNTTGGTESVPTNPEGPRAPGASLGRARRQAPSSPPNRRWMSRIKLGWLRFVVYRGGGGGGSVGAFDLFYDVKRALLDLLVNAAQVLPENTQQHSYVRRITGALLGDCLPTSIVAPVVHQHDFQAPGAAQRS